MRGALCVRIALRLFRNLDKSEVSANYPAAYGIKFCMLSFMNIVFTLSDCSRDVILGRSAEDYLLREFGGWEYAVAEQGKEEELFSEDAVNVVIPLDMPLVSVQDVTGAVESMRRRKISFMRLGGRESEARISIGFATDDGFFATGSSFLKLGGAKNRYIVYNSLKDRILERHLSRGVHIEDKNTVFIDDTVSIECGARILPFTRIEGDCSVACGAEISASYIYGGSVGEGANVFYSHLASSRVRARATVGPFARLRGADVGEGCRVGDFVEIKASALSKGVKCAHLTYIGDAEVGEDTNVGCGTVFCNYDGVNKHRTKVGKNCFIGANTNLIAPVTVGSDSFIAAGTTVTRDVEPSSFTIGRVRQETKKK